jgi:MoxR-like ATPase
MNMHPTFSTPINNKQLPNRKANALLNDEALYKPSEALWHAVSVALEMGLPLLLTGEPGTGKTQLAYYISWYFGLGKPEVFDAQTSSLASDLFYKYDALSHFQYSQSSNELLSKADVEARFIRFQALGKAIQENTPKVVLIDEIDKAPRDLPNNVLAALENLAFTVAETGSHYIASSENRPIIIMTSNSEKNLPDPFLRRVAYYHISMDEIDVLGILQAKVPGFASVDYASVIDFYQKIRAGRKVKLQKKPATAELIQWVGLLQKMGFPTAKLKDTDDLSPAEKAQLRTSFAVLVKTREDQVALDKMLAD